MSNVTVQEALKAAIEYIKSACVDDNFHEASCNVDEIYQLKKAALEGCKAALSEIEKCEKNKAVLYGVFILDGNGQWQIVHNYMVHVYIYEEPAHFYKEKIEYEAKEAGESIEVAIFKFYTSPQPRDWVSLSDEQIGDCLNEAELPTIMLNPIVVEKLGNFYKAIEAKLKQLNTKG